MTDDTNKSSYSASFLRPLLISEVMSSHTLPTATRLQNGNNVVETSRNLNSYSFVPSEKNRSGLRRKAGAGQMPFQATRKE